MHFPAKRLQSAMEFMMTYGWAILILIIVLATLYASGLFNIANSTPNICALPANIGCVSAYLSEQGTLLLNIQQATQYTINIISIGCNDQGIPANMIAVVPQTTLLIGSNSTFTTQCYKTVGGVLKLFNGTIGQNFKGYIILNYSDVATGFTHTTEGSLIEKVTTAQLSGPFGFGAAESVPITVTNTNALLSTGTSFQEQITVPASSYSAYEASDLGNIRFSSGSTELHSWCESGCTSGSGSSVFWVNLGSTSIPASGNTVVNLLFLTTSTEYDGAYAGECPTCSSSYGKYDNGASVFGFYDNFAGTTLNAAKWTTDGAGISTSNKLTIAPTSFSSIITSGSYSGSYYFEGYFINSVEPVPFGISTATTAFTQAAWYYPGYDADYYGSVMREEDVPAFGARAAIGTASFSGSASNFILSVGWPSTGVQTVLNNYAPLISTSNTLVAFTNTNYFYVGADEPDGASTYSWQWVRARVYPPGGAMPTTSFGSLV